MMVAAEAKAPTLILKSSKEQATLIDLKETHLFTLKLQIEMTTGILIQMVVLQRKEMSSTKKKNKIDSRSKISKTTFGAKAMVEAGESDFSESETQ
jgi:hypothetical protein